MQLNYCTQLPLEHNNLMAQKKTWLGLGKDEVLAYNTFFGQQVWSNMAGEHLPTLLIILFFISLSRFPPCITILLYFSQIMKVFQWFLFKLS